MSTIVTRAGKGSPLTNTEVDANFTNLNSDKYQSGDAPSFAKVTSTTADTSPNFEAVNTGTDANSGPVILLDRNSASPADGDNLGSVQWKGRNNADESTFFAKIFTEMVAVANGAESGRIEFQAITGGSVHPFVSCWTNNGQAENSINKNKQDIDFRVAGVNTAQLLFADANLKRVGINTDDPKTDLQVGISAADVSVLLAGPQSSANSAELLFSDNVSGADPHEYGMGIRYNSTANALNIDDNFNAGGSPNNARVTVMRDSGNVGIGVTSPTNKLHVDGGVRCTKVQSDNTNGRAADLNRKSSNGAIVQFQLDGVEKGTVGVNSIDELYIKNDTGGVRLSQDVLKPTLSGYNTNDNACNLGSTTSRFKSLYLSDGAFLGGTVNANKLDDYETGTWTVGISNSAGTETSSTTRTGQYTKIGRMVHVSANISNINNDAFSSGALRITGLPFAINTASSSRGHGACQVNNFVDSNVHYYFIQGVQGTQTAQIKFNKNNDTAHSVGVADLNNSDNSSIIFDLTYIV